jgi:hypothetical protein
MHSLFLFRDSTGRLPTAQDLHRCGFCVSKAALPLCGECEMDAPGARAPTVTKRALAAEPRAAYGVEQPPLARAPTVRPGEEGA